MQNEAAKWAGEGRFDDGTGQFALSRAPDLVMARDLMFGDEYMAQKARIMAPINEFVVLIEERTARQVEDLNGRARFLDWVALVVSVAAVLVSLAGRVVESWSPWQPLRRERRL